MIWSRTKVAPHSGQKEYEESIKASQPVKRIGYVSIDDFCLIKILFNTSDIYGYTSPENWLFPWFYPILLTSNMIQDIHS